MINKLIELLIPNMELILLGLVLLTVIVSARILSSTLRNVYVLNYKFDWKWFLSGILKGLVFVLVIGLLTVAASWFPTFLVLANITNPAMSEVVSVIAITAIIAAAVAKYFLETVTNVTSFLGLTKEEVDGYYENNTPMVATPVADTVTTVVSDDPSDTSVVG